MPKFNEDKETVQTGKVTKSKDFKEGDQSKVLSTHDFKPNKLKQPKLCISTRNLIPKRDKVTKEHIQKFVKKFKEKMKG